MPFMFIVDIVIEIVHLAQSKFKGTGENLLDHETFCCVMAVPPSCQTPENK